MSGLGGGGLQIFDKTVTRHVKMSKTFCFLNLFDVGNFRSDSKNRKIILFVPLPPRLDILKKTFVTARKVNN